MSLSSWRYHSLVKSNLCPSKSASVMRSNFAMVLFASRRISVSISGKAARICAIVRRRSAVWYIQIKFSSSTLKFMVRPPFRIVCCRPLPFSGWRPVLFRKAACGQKRGACKCPCPDSRFCQSARRCQNGLLRWTDVKIYTAAWQAAGPCPGWMPAW